MTAESEPIFACDPRRGRPISSGLPEIGRLRLAPRDEEERTDQSPAHAIRIARPRPCTARRLRECRYQAESTWLTRVQVDPAAGSQANIGSLSAVIAQNPSDANAYNVRGTAYGRAGKLREAIADFDAALKINPGFYQAYANRALVQRRLGHDDLALADYNKAIEINQS